jgi:hypothetical protein
MSLEEPYPAERLPDAGFAQMVAYLCARPGMYVGATDFSAVVAYIDGFNAARGGGPLLGFREWLVMRANTGNNLHWAGLVKLVISSAPESSSAHKQQEYWIQAAGKLIAEYLRYRDDNGITKVFYDYGRWLLRKRWYRGPLRKKGREPTS